MDVPRAPRWPPVLAVVLVAGSALAAGRPPVPDPGRPSPAPPPDEAVETYVRVLSALRARRAAEPGASIPLRLGAAEGPTWPLLRIRAIRPSGRGSVLLVEGDAREYRVGDAIRGARLVGLGAAEATLEFSGQRRTFLVGAAFPAIGVRSVRDIEGEWAVFVVGERRALYRGDTYKGARVVGIDPDGATFQVGDQVKKIAPPATGRTPGPLEFVGIIEVSGSRVALRKGRSEPVHVGDEIDGARVVDITPTHVVVERKGKRHAVEVP